MDFIVKCIQKERPLMSDLDAERIASAIRDEMKKRRPKDEEYELHHSDYKQGHEDGYNKALSVYDKALGIEEE